MAELKKCLHCGKEFETRESNDQWTKTKISKFYKHRKYCSDSCKTLACRSRALNRKHRKQNSEIIKNQQVGIMPHLEEWAKKHGLF